MDSSRLQSHLEALGLSAECAPDTATWQRLLVRLQQDPVYEQLLQRERYLDAVVAMQARLLATKSDELGAFNHALAPLGEAAGASRVYLFENHLREHDGKLLMSQRAEWCAPGVQPEIDNPLLQELAFDDFFPIWSETLQRGDPVIRLQPDYDAGEHEILDPQGILSLLVLPLSVDGEFTGFIGFDNCVSVRPWSRIEVNLLSAAANQIGLTMAQRRAGRRLAQANAEIIAARDRAVEANRAKSIFLAKISHELRTPLNAIIGYSELLHESPGTPGDPTWRSDVERIMGAGRHLLTVINDLLDLSRAEADKLLFHWGSIDVADLLTDLIAATQYLAQRNGNKLVTVIPSDLGPLTSDRTRVHQVLLNLLSNACKYTRGGTITLTVTAQPDQLEFEIVDTGIGIAADQLERIFEAFAQVDDSATRIYEGTGLGLAICRHLSQRLGATITVASTPGHGSQFTLVLPREPKPELLGT